METPVWMACVVFLLAHSHSSFSFRFPWSPTGRWEGEKRRQIARRRERGERRDASLPSSCSSFLSRAFLPDGSGGGRGTDDSDSRAKSHSLGPSTTWPRHNRVKVASRLSPRGWLSGARVGIGETARKRKNTRLERSESRGERGENKDKLTVTEWMGRRIHFGCDGEEERAPEREYTVTEC